ncbi:hypothetical protein K8R62_01315 [bacterium]|nr:hypothetical protein [bacterium]
MKERFIYSMCVHCYNWGHNKLVGREEIYIQVICGRCLKVSTICPQTMREYLKKEVRNDFSRPGSYGSSWSTSRLFNVNREGC